ncbi:MAG TPA: YukJ family protein, partial [Longimicrobium sp.]|nr:YukJ family protein [Longimicrobium sp.]
MPIRNYGVLKGRVIRGIPERGGHTPHYQVLVDADGVDFRVAVDTRAKGGAPDLLFFSEPEFEHSFLERLLALEDGFHPLEPNRESGALDYVRGSLVRREQMRPLPVDKPGRDNDLNEKIGALVDRAMADLDARMYAFGGRWGPEPQTADAEFGFLPGNGLHDVHMNQGNPPGRHAHDNGAWQDGALLFHFPDERRWA